MVARRPSSSTYPAIRKVDITGVLQQVIWELQGRWYFLRLQYEDCGLFTAPTFFGGREKEQ